MNCIGAIVVGLNPFGTGRGLSTETLLLIDSSTGCLNPFGTGRGLSTTATIYKNDETIVSIPLEQGGVFRQNGQDRYITEIQGLNPFGTGRGLSTHYSHQLKPPSIVSIPLEQGGVFRQIITGKRIPFTRLNPFGTGRGLSTAGVVWCLDG